MFDCFPGTIFLGGNWRRARAVVHTRSKRRLRVHSAGPAAPTQVGYLGGPPRTGRPLWTGRPSFFLVCQGNPVKPLGTMGVCW